MTFFSILSVVIAALAITFAFQNNEPLSVRFFSTVFEGSTALVILSSLLVGFVIGLILFVPSAVAARWKARTLARENETLKRRAGEEELQYEAPGLGKEGDENIDL